VNHEINGLVSTVGLKGDLPVSILTKIFVVILFVFSITFTSLMVSVVARTTNWRETAEKYREIERVCDTNLRHTHAASAARLATARDEVRAYQNNISELEAQIQVTQTEAIELRTQLAKVEAERSNAVAINRGLLGQLNVAESARAEYRKQRDSLETRDIDLERRNVDLNDRVNELTAHVSVLLEQQRHYEQQINILQKQSSANGMNRGRVAMESPEGLALPRITAATTVAASAIRGRVKLVDSELITISVGSTDGVKRGMVFVVHRDGEYIGDLQVSIVDPDEAAGKIIRTAQSNRPPAPNDQVTDAQTMGNPRG